MTLELVHSKEAPPAIGPYSHAVISAGLIFVSGQLPLDPATETITPGTAADQFRTALDNAETILAACGATLSDVVKTTVFVTDLAAFADINAAYAERFGAHAPARSVVEVSRLPRGASVEIELVAAAGVPMSADPAVAPVTGPLRPRRHPWRVIIGAAAILFFANLLYKIALNEGFQWDVVGQYFTAPIILRGLVSTIWLTIATVVLGFLFGTLLAVARLSHNPVLQALSWGYVWFFRSVPLLVLILFTFNIGYLIPTIEVGLPFMESWISVPTNSVVTPLGAGLLALTLHEAAYAAEIVRGGILGVDQGQFEAASALGMSRRRTMVRIVIPQAMRSIIPSAGNQLIGMLKGTSMVSVIAVGDLLYSAQTVYNRTFQVVPLLMVATIWYVIVTTIMSWGQYYIERYFARGATRQMPMTPLQWLRARAATLGRSQAPVRAAIRP